MKKISEKKTQQHAFAYLITIRTYATWLHGDERGSIDRKHNQINTPLMESSLVLYRSMQLALSNTVFVLDKNMQNTVLQSLRETCSSLKWKVFAIHVRTNHVHLLLQSSASKEKTMGTLKRHATKDLKKYYPELSGRRKFWSRHGSTKNIWVLEALFPALHYVIKQQGKPMALYYDEQCYDLKNAALYECYLK